MWFESGQWQAWRDVSAEGGAGLRVEGEMRVPNPGVMPFLVPASPDKGADGILYLQLQFERKPGMWIQVVSQARASYVLPDEQGGAQITRVVITGEDGWRLELDVAN